MAKRILISFMGITKYKTAEYTYADQGKEYTYELTHFGQNALINSYIPRKEAGKKPDKVYLFVTPDIINSANTPETAVYDAADMSKGMNNYAYLKEELSHSAGNTEVIPVQYESTIQGIELFDLIKENILNQQEKEKIKLYIDATNSFRSVPITMFTVMNMIEKTYGSNVKFAGILYWMGNKTNTEFKLVDLLPVFNEKHIAEEIDRFNRTFYIGDIVQYVDTSNVNVKEMCEKLKGISDSLQMVNLDSLTKYLRESKTVVDRLLGSGMESPVLKTYVEAFSKTINSLVMDNDFFTQLKVADELMEREQIQVAITLLEAAYIHFICDLLVKNGAKLPKNEKDRYTIAKYTAAEIGLDFAGRRVDDTHNYDLAVKIIKTLYKTVSSEKRRGYKRSIRKFLDIRNEMNHGNYSGDNIYDIKMTAKDFSSTLRLLHKTLYI